MEIWKDVPGYEGLYQVSNLGNVKSIRRNKILKDNCSQEYKKVVLSVKNKTKTFSVHRLVALAFLKKEEDKIYVNHKDGNKLNNNLENLEWCTSKENTYHALEKKLINSNFLVFKEEIIKDYLENKMSMIEIGKKYNCSHVSISRNLELLGIKKERRGRKK